MGDEGVREGMSGRKRMTQKEKNWRRKREIEGMTKKKGEDIQ